MMEFSILLGHSLVCVFGLILKWAPAGCASSFLSQVLLFSVIGTLTVAFCFRAKGKPGNESEPELSIIHCSNPSLQAAQSPRPSQRFLSFWCWGTRTKAPNQSTKMATCLCSFRKSSHIDP